MLKIFFKMKTSLFTLPYMQSVLIEYPTNYNRFELSNIIEGRLKGKALETIKENIQKYKIGYQILKEKDKNYIKSIL